ncbi:MAG: AMP-binding protein [Gammaproteobacteria bacterium]|nr:AMP-binding protein [Gammaproteobacteria bacterium]
MKLPDTLTQALDARAGMRRHIHYIAGEEQKSQMSFAALKATALGVLRHFQDFGMQAGDELIIFTSSNEQFIDSFWACLYGGIVPVPVAVGISDDHRLKLLKIFRQLRHPWVYTEKAQLGRLREYAAEAGLLAEFEALNARALPVENLRELAGAGTPRLAKPGDVAFIQFSSGSTSDPKGVVLTHANVMANLRGITRCAAFTEEDVSLSWMPLTHDMGLIGFHLCMLASGIEHTIMDTRLFSRRPLLWLQEAAQRGATLLSSPNFGYKHFLKVFESRGLDAIDLSRVRLIFNGAEPISVPLCERFLQAMAPFGLRREAMYPVYGLAEASLAVTFPPPGRAYRTVTVDRRSLGAGQAVRSIDAGQRDALELMRLGSAVDHCAIRIVDDSGAVVAAGHVGHIEIRGDNVTGGYHGGVNAEAFTTDGWLRTGDLGFEVEGELVVTGRHKELIFANGENCYPHDIESIAADGTGVELGKLAVAGARRPGADEDELLVFLLHRSALADFIPLANRVRRRITEQTALQVAHLLPVKNIPKTTSGKVQRGLLARAYEEGQFDAVMQELDAMRLEHHDPSVETESDIVQMLRRIFASVVTDRRVGVDDDFFEIGISSIALAQIFERIDEEYPGLLAIEDLFDRTSIRAIAAFLEERLTER